MPYAVACVASGVTVDVALRFTESAEMSPPLTSTAASAQCVARATTQPNVGPPFAVAPASSETLPLVVMAALSARMMRSIWMMRLAMPSAIAPMTVSWSIPPPPRIVKDEDGAEKETVSKPAPLSVSWPATSWSSASPLSELPRSKIASAVSPEFTIGSMLRYSITVASR